ncbi:hypothetical protein FRX31_005876 [Thalictrum thalictroides]|uniref:DUF4283 domain-containing protein n=1 Tax=Thalictrum thalictroides TaxID=46969 RepID=A0A7J6X649_THATH|nr:hypothetical protein FRX31_005876 [Thalictrum thalictroides]
MWISFKGLLLEHLSVNSIRVIAEDVGEVSDVLPDKDLPRDANGFRAQIWAEIDKPILKGMKVSSLYQGVIWVKIKYNNPPSLNHKTCMHQGHDYQSCMYFRN